MENENMENGNGKMKMGALMSALPNINNNNNRPKSSNKLETTMRKPEKKQKKSMTRRNVKHKNLKKSKNTLRKNTLKRIQTLRKELINVKRKTTVKSIRITKDSEEGLEKLKKKLEKLMHFYEEANVMKQSDMSIYMVLLTSKFQEAFDKELKEDFYTKYPTLFDRTEAEEYPYEYLEELDDLMNSMLKNYKKYRSEDKKMEWDLQADILLNAVAEAGKAFDEIEKNAAKKKENKTEETRKEETQKNENQKDESMNAFSNFFGGLKV